MKHLYTIGHSNHLWKEFIEIIKNHHITQIIDIRTIPKSRFPWFNKNKLINELLKENIVYHHLPELGGLRHPAKESINRGWENSGFRGFADYMQTPEFFNGFKILNKFINTENRTAIMCAEALPWRCHRSLVADAEVVRKRKILHILSKTSIKEHVLTSFARIDRSKRPIKIYYP